MRIGIWGAGHIGETVGRLWCEAGHQVRFGTRRPVETAAVLETIGPNASAGTPREAVEFADVILLAVPPNAIPEFANSLARALTKNIVRDAANPYPERDGKAAREALRRFA